MFSILTSKIYGGVAVGLALALAYVVVTKNAVIDNQAETLRENTTTIGNLKSDLRTARSNNDKLEFGIQQCNAGVQAAADAASVVAQAGVRAVEQTRKAGAAVAAKVDRINALPAAGPPSALCEQADDILLEGAR